MKQVKYIIWEKINQYKNTTIDNNNVGEYTLNSIWDFIEDKSGFITNNRISQ